MDFVFLSGKKWLKIKVNRISYPLMSSGLMFRNKSIGSLLFEFKKDVRLSLTALFVFFPFLAIWLDEKNNVVGYKFVKPFEYSISCKKPYRKLLEVPVNAKNSKLLRFFVEKHGKV